MDKFWTTLTKEILEEYSLDGLHYRMFEHRPIVGDRMQNYFQNQSIGKKVLTGMLLVIAMGAGSGLFGLFSMSKIGKGMKTITQENLPMLNRMASINEQQLEQLLIFERGMQLALIISSMDDGYQRVSELKKAYADRGKELSSAIKNFIVVAEQAATDGADRKRTEFTGLARQMKVIHAEYLASQEKANEIFDYMLQGRIDDAGPLVEKAQHDSQKTRDQLKSMHRVIIQKTSNAADESSSQEAAAYGAMTMLIIASVFAGLFFATLITRGISRPLRDTVRGLQDIARGDLTKRLNVSGKDELAQLGHAFNQFADKIHQVLLDVTKTAEFIVEGSRGISNSNNNLLNRSNNQRERLSESSSNLDAMTAILKVNAASTNEAKQLADANQSRAVAGADVVMQAVEAVTEINSSSDRITDIIGTIDGIAFQTNLLALNAAVEAARAGDQGRGFAVVASEVRSLAQRSADAAREIKSLIEDSLSKVHTGTRLVDESGKALAEIKVSAKRVADLLEEIARQGHEQAVGIEQVNASIAQMDQMTEENAVMVRETASASGTMLDQVENLMQQISYFEVAYNENSLPASGDTQIYLQ